MSASKSLLGILISLFLGAVFLFAGSFNSILIDGLPLFVLCGMVGFVLHWLIFVPSFIFSTEHYFDLTGSISYVTTVILACLLTPELHIRDIIISIMVLVWAIRLGSFLFTRVKRDGQDRRFEVMKHRFVWFLMTWTLGGLWVLVTLCAALAAITSSNKLDLGVLGILGIVLWCLGFVIEVVADHQKMQFRKVPENKDRFISDGLWSWSQHPNYFGEILLWLGVAFTAFPVLSGIQMLTLISPIFVYLLLTKVSGIPLLDRLANNKWGDDADYQKYIRSTSKLVLLPPK